MPDYEHFDEEKAKAQYTAFLSKKQVFVDAAWRSTAFALPHKVEPARAVTAHTLADTQPAKPPATALAQLGAVMRASFPKRPNAEKVKLLQTSGTSWARARCSRNSAPSQSSPTKNSGLNADNFEASPRDLRAIALRRWFEFEPDAATREVHQPDRLCHTHPQRQRPRLPAPANPPAVRAHLGKSLQRRELFESIRLRRHGQPYGLAHTLWHRLRRDPDASRGHITAPIRGWQP